MKISGVVIVKNAEEFITECLNSLSFCDEVVVVDSGSTDNTLSIAKKFNCKIIKENFNDFSEMRNVGLHEASGDWIVYLDADERISKELSKEIMHVLSQPIDYGAFKIPRQNYYLGKNPWPYIEHIERLFNRKKLKKWYGKIHESPEVNGKIGNLQNPIFHFTHRTLQLMVTKTVEWSKIEAKLRYDNNHPPMKWWRFPRVMIQAFYHSYITEGGWKVGTVGIIESLYQAFSIFITYAQLWELQKNHEDH